MDVEEAYRHCARLTRQAARNFYYGIRLLPEHKRNALSAIYAFSRILDDSVDDFSGEEAAGRLQEAARLLDRALSPEADDDHHPVVRALAHTLRRFELPVEPFLELIAGMEMDLTVSTYETFEELLVYCRRVAGAVGRISLEVFGYTRPEAVPLADDMGVALQLTNILRDVKEDYARGRVYLPQESLRRHGVSPNAFAGRKVTRELQAVLAETAQQAETYYRRAERLFPLVSADARLCPMALFTIYRELLSQIAAVDYDVLRVRVRISTARKLQLIGTLFWQTWRTKASQA